MVPVISVPLRSDLSVQLHYMACMRYTKYVGISSSVSSSIPVHCSRSVYRVYCQVYKCIMIGGVFVLQPSTSKTPMLSALSPLTGPPGGLINMKGKLFTSRIGSHEHASTNGKMEKIVRFVLRLHTSKQIFLLCVNNICRLEIFAILLQPLFPRLKSKINALDIISKLATKILNPRNIPFYGGCILDILDLPVKAARIRVLMTV